MSYILVDVEADGPCPGIYSMVCFGAVVVRPGLADTFYGRTRPISDAWIPEALAVSGFERDAHEGFPAPADTMAEFVRWTERVSKGRPRFISDNNGFDWQWINYYLHAFVGSNPFGHSSANLGSLYKGLVKTDFENFKHLRETVHDHHPVNDAVGNAEALLHMKQEMGLKIRLD